MNPTKLQIVQQIVRQAPKDALANHKKRRVFALQLAQRLDIWDEFALSFVEEMAGLNFKRHEDRELFIQFAETGL